jgi:acyl-CoA synthetase (NDP forming)
MLPAHASTLNPVDFAGGGEEDVMSYPRVAGALLGSGELDGVVLTGYFGGYGHAGEVRAAQELARIASASDVPLVVHTMYGDGDVATALRDGGVPVYREVEAVADALSLLRAPAPTAPIPDVPAPGAEVAGGYWGARALVASAGIELAPARPVRDADGAVDAARELGYPVVLKALGALHKSEGGGVVLGIPDAAALREAFDGMTARLAPDELSVERMAPPVGVELLVGTRTDHRFGPIVLAGLGGVYAEVLRDFAVALAPVDAAGAREMLLRLRGAALLTGARGRAPVDLGAAAEAIAALSRIASPDVEELEINPLLVSADGALALDARVIRAGGDVTAGNTRATLRNR